MAHEVSNPLRQFAAHYHDRANARAAVAEMHTLFKSLPTELDKEIDLSISAGAITKQEKDSADTVPSSDSSDIALHTDNLIIHVPGRGDRLIDGLSFELKRGQVAAIMGDSGIGKTSLLETLAGLREAEGGIYLADRPLENWATSELRQHLTLIGQHPYVHTGTIAENLRLAAPHADDAALEKAVRLAAMSDFISQLPDGLDTRLETRGYGLSGGQLQRVALARLFLADPEVILLDEPTANLDPETRDLLLDNLIEFAKGRSLLIVTHDPVVAQRADIIWRLTEQSLITIDKENLMQEAAQ